MPNGRGVAKWRRVPRQQRLARATARCSLMPLHGVHRWRASKSFEKKWRSAARPMASFRVESASISRRCQTPAAIFTADSSTIHDRLRNCLWPTAGLSMTTNSSVYGRPQHYLWPIAPVFMAECKGFMVGCGTIYDKLQHDMWKTYSTVHSRQQHCLWPTTAPTSALFMADHIAVYGRP